MTRIVIEPRRPSRGPMAALVLAVMAILVGITLPINATQPEDAPVPQELPNLSEAAEPMEAAPEEEADPVAATIAEPAADSGAEPEAGSTGLDMDSMKSRDFFARLDFGESYWGMLLDGEPLAMEEQEAIVRSLTRLRRLQPHRTTRWLRLEVPWERLVDEPAAERLEIFLLTGQVNAVRSEEIPPEASERAGLEAYYEIDVSFHREGGAVPGVIIVEHIPPAWKKALESGGTMEGQPFSCPGIFLKAYPVAEDGSAFVFATPKLSWHPREPNSALGITAAHVRLAEQGMDIAELAYVEDRAKFSGLEREPFYQMMAAVNRLTTSEQQPTVEASVSELLTQKRDGLMVTPERYRAEFLRARGLCRRITRIEVDDEDIQQRLGLSHYYEVSIFVPIEAPIVSQRQGDEATRKEFSHDYPVLVCVPELPPGLEVGEDLHRNVAVTGSFFKLWAYRTPFMSREDFTRRQISPLLIASSVQVIQPPEAPQMNEFVMAMGLVLLVVVGVGIAFGVLFARRTDARRR